MSDSQLPPLERLLELQRLLFDFRNVKRVVNLPNAEAENDIEHSYSLAMTAWYIAQYFPELDRDTIIRYSLIHDLVEVHAGDTYIYADAATLASKQQREADALQKLTQDWQDFPELSADIAAYEKLDTPESAFVYALDKIMPIMVIYIGEGYTWKLEKITLEMLHDKKKDKISISPEIMHYYTALYELLQKSPHLIPAK